MNIPVGLEMDARAYASRRARRESCAVLVYSRNGIVFVRADYEPAPEGAAVIFNTAEEAA